MAIYKPHTERLVKVEQHASKLLERLPVELYYHNADHTLDPKVGVVAIADYHSLNERVSPIERDLIIAAAYFHDTGYLEQKENNEPIGARIAGNVLPSLGYSPLEVEMIQMMILDTKVPTNPRNNLSQILCDADVDNLGRKDFFERGEKLRKEVGVEHKQVWYQGSIKFLESHEYYTKSAQDLRDEGKKKNLRMLHMLLDGR